MDVDAVMLRLKRIEGQIRGIIRMIGEDKPCEDILIQIGSAKAALHKTGQIVLQGHVRHCVPDGIESGRKDEMMDRLFSAIEQFSRMV